jgi:hypothetical protein
MMVGRAGAALGPRELGSVVPSRGAANAALKEGREFGTVAADE